MKIVGKKDHFTSFLLKLTLVALFTLFLSLDYLHGNPFTRDAFFQVLADPRLMAVCLICLPWNKLERVAQRTGRLRLAQSLVLARIGILTITSIIILASSSQAVLDHSDMERQLSRDKKRINGLKAKYGSVLTGHDLASEILERENLIDLLDWVTATIPLNYSWILVAPNPSTLDFVVSDAQYNFSYYLLWTEEGDPDVPDDGWPIIISSDVFNDNELRNSLEANLVIPFPSNWTNTTESLDLIVWIEELDPRPPNFDGDRTMLRPSLAWRVMDMEDNGNAIPDVSVSNSCLIIDEDATKTLRIEIAELTLIQGADEIISADEQVIEEHAPGFLLGLFLLIVAIPGTGYYALRAMNAILNWKTTQLQNWGAFQKKLESLQEGLILEGNRVNGYAWADLKCFVDWNKPVVIRITETKYGQLLEAIYQDAPLETVFIIQEGTSEDRFTKQTGRFAVDFSQPLEMKNRNLLTTPSENKMP